jgi:DNA-binding transcriptional regulator YhcF (GntR family)
MDSSKRVAAIKIDYGRATAVHLQIARALEAEIRGGKIPPGTRLPTVREIAVTLSVTTSTVQRAMNELAGTGMIVAQGSAGTFVRSDLSEIASIEERTERFARSVLDDIDRLGYDREAVARLISGERKQK